MYIYEDFYIYTAHHTRFIRLMSSELYTHDCESHTHTHTCATLTREHTYDRSMNMGVCVEDASC